MTSCRAPTYTSNVVGVTTTYSDWLFVFASPKAGETGSHFAADLVPQSSWVPGSATPDHDVHLREPSQKYAEPIDRTMTASISEIPASNLQTYCYQTRVVAGLSRRPGPILPYRAGGRIEGPKRRASVRFDIDRGVIDPHAACHHLHRVHVDWSPPIEVYSCHDTASRLTICAARCIWDLPHRRFNRCPPSIRPGCRCTSRIYDRYSGRHYNGLPATIRVPDLASIHRLAVCRGERAIG